MGGVRILDPDLARRLVLHEALAQQTPTRELRDLGDGWLFHDTGDAEPFWNRLVAPRWPVGTAEFDRRLDEVITLFSALGRLPHVRPLPLGGTPTDLAGRLARAGFDTVGADLRMVLMHHGDPDALVAALTARVERAFGGGSVVSVSRREWSRGAGRAAAGTDGPGGIGGYGGPRRTIRPGGASAGRQWAERRRWAVDASLVLADAFGVDPNRRVALENDVLACVSRPGCSVVLMSIDGVPAAIARRATTDAGSYLSSIGTRPAFRGRGLGGLATAIAVRDALAAGSEVVHLGVEADNEPALRLYERLGFVTVGEAAPDLLLR